MPPRKLQAGAINGIFNQPTNLPRNKAPTNIQAYRDLLPSPYQSHENNVNLARYTNISQQVPKFRTHKHNLCQATPNKPPLDTQLS